MKFISVPARLPRRVLLISGGLLGLSVVYFMIVPMLSLYMSIRLHSSPAQIGVVLAVMAAANQGLQMFVGILSDRFSIRVVLSWGILIACFGYAGFSDHPSFPVQIGSGFALGLGTAATSVLGKAILADAAGAKKESAFALRAAAVNGGGAVGPLIGGLLFGWFPVMLLVTIVIYVSFWLFLIRPMPRSVAAADEDVAEAANSESIRRQVRTLLSVRPLLVLSAVSAGFWFLYTQLTLTFALYANDRFRLGGKVGLLFAVEAVVAVLLQYPAITWLQRRTENWRVLGIGCLMLAAAFVFLSAILTVWTLVLFVIVFALGSLLVVPTLDIVATDLSPTVAVAGALGVASLGWAAGGLVGNVLGGILYGEARQSGHFSYFWGFNSLLAVTTAVAFFAVGRRWSRRALAPQIGRQE
jgi:DHA1 family multidrug resistance protein-like MFS transporter